MELSCIDPRHIPHVTKQIDGEAWKRGGDCIYSLELLEREVERMSHLLWRCVQTQEIAIIGGSGGGIVG